MISMAKKPAGMIWMPKLIRHWWLLESGIWV